MTDSSTPPPEQTVPSTPEPPETVILPPEAAQLARACEAALQQTQAGLQQLQLALQALLTRELSRTTGVDLDTYHYKLDTQRGLLHRHDGPA